ncbi:alpha-L-glutamate ligase [Saxibacter everestensis]|uniref:Alpha-L-glutamate ligase n=1 Tax=Saxibacter everestensis TaxID=2909229 RepID=A0ABY8QPR7_9MICO|nr:alpha-L-glutamate ligase [Brevibacteriaceae bacterium ZFBP1038]
MPKIYALHENPEWFPPFAEALEAVGLDYEEWMLTTGSIDLDAEPPEGIFWSRFSASSHTRGNVLAKDYARTLFDWLQAHGRRVVNGRDVLELEVSKVRQLTFLKAFGIDVPRTVAVTGDDELLSAAGKLPTPFITKHNQGGKGLGVRKFESVAELSDALPGLERPVDGVMLLQEYVEPLKPFITRVETVGYEYVYAITADTGRGGFQLCPADACEIGPDGQPIEDDSLFALREGFDHPIIEKYLAFARKYRLEIAGFEFIESADGRIVTYDVNTNTNYNADVEADAPASGPASIARYLKSLL